jgi:hypothetical protein
VGCGNWSGQGAAWNGRSGMCLGLLVVSLLPFLPVTAHAQQRSPSAETKMQRAEGGSVEDHPSEESPQFKRTGHGGADILTELLVSGGMDTQGIRTNEVPLPQQELNPVKVLRATCFRSVNRVAVRLEIQVPEGPVWTTAEAVLKNENGVTPLKSWPLTPLSPGRAILIFEREAGAGELKATYDIEVHEAGGKRAFFIGQLQFP